jgi:V/A-type H+-transporting ATPase subunit I
MFRPERVSKTSLIFFKSDTEEVLNTLSKHEAFHIIIKENSNIESENLNKLKFLIERIDDIIKRIKNIPGIEIELKIEPCYQFPELKEITSLISNIENEVNNYENKIKKFEEILSLENSLNFFILLWKPIAISLKEILPFHSKYFSFVALYQKESSPTAINIPFPSIVINISQNPNIILLICFKNDEYKVKKYLEEAGYIEIPKFNNMPKNIFEANEVIRLLENKLNEVFIIKNELISTLSEATSKLSYLKLFLSDIISIVNIKENYSFGRNLIILEGYVPTRNVNPLFKDLREKLNGRIIMTHVEEHSSREVPVIFRYPKFIKIFESITYLYGAPSYNEINPTPILAITFPLFFGFMFGDIGHGIMLSLLGLFLYKYTKSLSKIGIYLFICGIFSTIIGGFLYGEAFGKHVFHGIFSPSKDLVSLLKFSLYIGIAHISIGMIIQIINNLIQNKKTDAFLVNLPRVILYICFIYLVFGFGLNIMKWLKGPILLMIIPMIFMMIGKPIWALISHGKEEFLSVFGEIGFETIDTVIRFISNTVSYLRIAAMVMAHIYLTNVFYSLSYIAGEGIIGSIFSWLIAIIGNIFVVLLESIVVIAQNLRLHFYEWFSKFFENNGVKFSPFKLTILTK